MTADRRLHWLHMGCGERLGSSGLERLRTQDKSKGPVADQKQPHLPATKPRSRR